MGFHWGAEDPNGFEAGIWQGGFPHTLCPSRRFAPSLRQLKQQALLLHFPPTVPARLVQRLQEVRGWGGVGYRAQAACLRMGWGDMAFPIISLLHPGSHPLCCCYCYYPLPQPAQVLRVRGDWITVDSGGGWSLAGNETSSWGMQPLSPLGREQLLTCFQGGHGHKVGLQGHVDTHALISCRSPYGRACRLTQVPWQPCVRRRTMIFAPASTPCR